jgi:hypothetical protein
MSVVLDPVDAMIRYPPSTSPVVNTDRGTNRPLPVGERILLLSLLTVERIVGPTV